MAKNTRQKQNQKPEAGEATKEQTGLGGVATLFTGAFQGFGKPPPGTYSTYRSMRANPTVALARAVAMAPVRTAMWSVEAEEGVSDDIKGFIERQTKNFWPELIRNVLFALDYGWAPFEKVWEVRDGKFVYKKIKPLLIDITDIQVNRDTGEFAGIRQNEGTELLANKCFIYIYDSEAGDFYGRSRHENIRATAWNHWQAISERSGQYFKKIAGITPMVEYPEGESKNKDGIVKSNYELAVAVLNALGSGNGVAMPNTFSRWAGDLAKSGVDLAKLKAWNISFLESKGNHGRGFTDRLRHLESLMMRGWLVPERAATEGQYGTKAESESQAELALVIADLVFADILRYVNSYLINPLLEYNFSESLKNRVYLKRGSIDPVQRIFFRELIKQVLGEPMNIGLFMDVVDIEQLVDAVGLPKTKESAGKMPDEKTVEQSGIRKIYHNLAAIIKPK